MRMLARIETAKPSDLKEINQIAKSIGRIGARIDAGVRHKISQRLPQTLIKPYAFSEIANLHTLQEIQLGGPERGLKRRGAAIQENQSNGGVNWEDRSED